MDLQKMIDAMNAMSKHTRANYHLTLGKVIDILAAAPADLPVVFDHNNASPCDPHSYRGYYDDLAFECCAEPITVKQFLFECGDALGKTFMGYKGGDYLMEGDTPLWCATYGHSEGRPIMDLLVGEDKAVLITKEPEH